MLHCFLKYLAFNYLSMYMGVRYLLLEQNVRIFRHFEMRELLPAFSIRTQNKIRTIVHFVQSHQTPLGNGRNKCAVISHSN